MVCSVLGVKGKKYETVILVPFSVVFCVPHAMFVTRAVDPKQLKNVGPIPVSYLALAKAVVLTALLDTEPVTVSQVRNAL